jgi:hypothetical protein
MRIRWNIPVLCLGLVWEIGSVCAAPNFFPSDFDSRANQVWDGYSKKIISLLELVSEPSLFELRGRTAPEGYRILVSGRECLPVVMRLQIASDGSCFFHFKRGIHGEGRLITDVKMKKLDAKKGSSVREIFIKANFWELPSSRHAAVDDGNTFVIEALKEGKYHAISRTGVDEQLLTIFYRLAEESDFFFIGPRRIY